MAPPGCKFYPAEFSMVYGCGSFIITFEESVVNFSLQDSNMKGGSGNVEERENIRERLKKHKLSYVWLIGQLALRGYCD